MGASIPIQPACMCRLRLITEGLAMTRSARSQTQEQSSFDHVVCHVTIVKVAPNAVSLIWQ